MCSELSVFYVNNGRFSNIINLKVFIALVKNSILFILIRTTLFK